ncbi:MAG TPA: amidase [Solirubrobacteraceae bacterium]|nr:amidase [Solirubrobacteraceae bacterium]
MLSELAFADATDLAELIRRRELAPAELVAATIARIEALNPRLNAVVTPMFDEAAAAAERVDLKAPFAGVPLLVKDLVAECAGVRHTNGSRFLAGHVAREDSELVRRLRGAGFIPTALTSTPEFGGAPVTEGRLFGQTRNPWNLELSPAGSSGGAAAAVAAGIVPLAHGNDMGGSLRNPASCCGIFALKPSRGRMPLEPEHGELLSRLLVEHAVTRSVRDSARLLDHTHGAQPGDPYPAPAPEPGAFERALRSPARTLRIALSTETPTGGQPHPECAAAAERAARLCAELGHEVVRASPDIDGPALLDAWFGLWTEVMMSLALEAQAAAGRPLCAEELEPRTWRWYEAGRRRTAAEHLRSLGTIQEGARAVAELLTEYDVWLTPTLGLPAIPLGGFDAGTGDTVDVERYTSFSPYTRLANMTGCPAMSVPAHWTAEGVPVGAHFLGRMWDEATLLALAHQLELAAPWRDRRPPVRVGAAG